MKLIIAGSRELDAAVDEGVILLATSSLISVCPLLVGHWPFDEIVSGTAPGGDQIGERYALHNSYKLTKMPADWTLGKSAGFIRNAQMAEYGDALIALWNGSSGGTKNMIESMTARGKPTLTVNCTMASHGSYSMSYDQQLWLKLSRRRFIVNLNVTTSCDAIVARPYKYGNPFHISAAQTREQAIERYRHWLPTQPSLMAGLPALRGKILGCYCKPLDCHADVLVELANR